MVVLPLTLSVVAWVVGGDCAGQKEKSGKIGEMHCGKFVE